LSDVWSLRVRMLYGFDSEIPKEFAVDNQLRIRRVKKSEIADWGSGGPFVLECVSRNSREGEMRMKKLAASLLLFKRNYDGLSKYLPSFRLGLGSSATWQSSQLPSIKTEDVESVPMRYPGYPFRWTEMDDFRAFWTDCNQTDWHKSLLVAGNRLLKAQTRVGDAVLEDRLIDLMIACEALVLDHDHGKGENIAHRVGKLQKQQTPHLEKSATSNLGLAYRLRNDIVHDGEFSPPNLAQVPFLERFVMSVEQYLRIGMVNYIDLMNQSQSKKDIIQYLDGLPRAI
jgi:hypothetical protein